MVNYNIIIIFVLNKNTKKKIKIMKKLVTLITILLGLNTFSQSIDLNVNHDVKYMFNKTLDLTVALELKGKETYNGYYLLRPEYERAIVDEEMFNRVSINTGYTLKFDKFDFTSTLGFGLSTHGSNIIRPSAGLNFQPSYQIYNRIKLYADLQIMQIYNHNPVLSNKIGFKINILNKKEKYRPKY